MAPKIFSILTLIIAGVAIYLGFEANKLVVTLQDQGLKTFNVLEVTRADLKATKQKLTETEDVLTKTQVELAETKTKLRDTEAELASTKTKLAAAEAERDAQKAALVDMRKKISEALGGVPIPEGEDPTKAIETIKEQIATMASKVKEQEATIVGLEKSKAEMETVIVGLNAEKQKNETEIAVKGKVIKKFEKNIMDKGLKGTVMAVNPGWGFCVLSTGDKQGAAANKVMIVARGGKAIGKVRITSVEANQSIADILTSTFVRGQYVQPGDEVIYTGEDKVKFDQAELGAAAIVNPPLPVKAP